MRLPIRFIIALVFLMTPASASEVATSAGPVTITRIAGGLEEPWSLAFLPDGGFLVSERGGRLWRHDASGAARAIGGAPAVYAQGQGGLFDILVPQDFDRKGEILISFAQPQGGQGAGTAVAAARLDGDSLSAVRVIWRMPPGSEGGRHFGGRLAEAPDGAIFLTIGERGAFDPAQDLDRLHGKIIRITRDGRAATGNPFPDRAGGEIWSLGHRNPQGMTFDGQGRLWASEHGARGGDEINLIRKGANYGWPEVAFGRHYSGMKIGQGTAAPGMTGPAHYWDPSIAPSGHMVYSGRLWPQWAGDHFVGSLKFDHIARLDPEAPAPTGWAQEVIRARETGRVRDIREAPDGTIWFLSVDRGAVFRLSPAG